LEQELRIVATILPRLCGIAAEVAVAPEKLRPCSGNPSILCLISDALLRQAHLGENFRYFRTYNSQIDDLASHNASCHRINIAIAMFSCFLEIATMTF